MSRTMALWSAAALTLLFSLVVGSILLRPSLTAGEAASAADAQPTVVVRSSNQAAGAEQVAPAAWESDDDDHDAWESDRSHKDDHEHEDDHDDDDD